MKINKTIKLNTLFFSIITIVTFSCQKTDTEKIEEVVIPFMTVEITIENGEKISYENYEYTESIINGGSSGLADTTYYCYEQRGFKISLDEGEFLKENYATLFLHRLYNCNSNSGFFPINVIKAINDQTNSASNSGFLYPGISIYDNGKNYRSLYWEQSGSLELLKYDTNALINISHERIEPKICCDGSFENLFKIEYQGYLYDETFEDSIKIENTEISILLY